MKLQCYLCKFSTQLKFEFDQHMIKHKINKSESGVRPAPVGSGAEQGQVLPKTKQRGSDFFCTPCNLSFTSSLSLVNHKKVRHNTARIKCKLCDFSHVSPAILKQHVKIEHSAMRVSDFFCKECSLSFSSKKVLESHMNVRHSGGVVIKSAKMASSRVNNCNKRKRLSHPAPGSRPLQPPLPSLPLSSPVMKKTWMATVPQPSSTPSQYKDMAGSTTGRFCCRTCGFKTDDKQTLEEHSANLPSVYVCSFCAFETHWSATVTEHKIAKHPESVKFPCDMCEFRTCNEAGVIAHKRYVHGVIEII